MQQKKLDRILKNSRITPAFQQLRINNYDTKGKDPIVLQAKKVAIDYVKTFEQIRHERDNSLALLGQPGVGKTHLCCAVANALMAQGIPVLYFSHRDGFSELKATFGRKDNFWEVDRKSDCNQKVEAIKTVDVLVWDDLFKGSKISDFEFDIVFEVLNYRYINHLPVVVSSELLVKDLLKLDQGVGRRIIEPARGHLIEFPPNPAMIHGLA